MKRYVLPSCVLILSAGLLPSCTEMPKLEDHVTPAARLAPYPALVPLEPLLASATDTRIPDETDDALKARAAALKARAARIQEAQTP